MQGEQASLYVTKEQMLCRVSQAFINTAEPCCPDTRWREKMSSLGAFLREPLHAVDESYLKHTQQSACGVCVCVCGLDSLN